MLVSITCMPPPVYVSIKNDPSPTLKPLAHDKSLLWVLNFSSHAELSEPCVFSSAKVCR